MGSLLLERQGSLEEIFGYEVDRPRRRLASHDPRLAEIEGDRGAADALDLNRTDAHGRLTLDDLITCVWEGLAVRDAVRCPVCDGAMASRPAAQGEGREGDCLDCGAHLD